MNEAVVKTRSGAVRGRNEQGVAAFKGIPFAAPPVGLRRFAAPVPPEPWGGVRDAGAFSSTPPQQDLTSRSIPGLDLSPIVGEGWRKGADYLTLNIWAPDPGARGLPVMVFIYGGAFVAGGSSTSLYSGARFARDGVVFVSLLPARRRRFPSPGRWRDQPGFARPDRRPHLGEGQHRRVWRRPQQCDDIW
jgi:para-nitrobenzyl esterase